MYTKLTIQEKLKDERTNRHLTLLELEKETGIGHATLGKYESDNCTDMSPFNLMKLAEFYGISMDYLMGLTENKNHPNTPLTDLHLNDSAIDILKSGRINNRLLCEMITHPDFVRFLVDIEICVDRIADMHIREMNGMLAGTRKLLIDKFAPPEDDLVMRTLDLADVDSDIFFGHVIHDDIDGIVKDIRKSHENDDTTADKVQTFGEVTNEEMQFVLDEAEKQKLSLDEKRAYLICRTLGIKYSSLADDDRKSLIRICKKSPFLKTLSSQRGKASPQMTHGKGNKKKRRSIRPISPRAFQA